jgi:uncharacterized protein YjiS (DUF1127 family)
MTSAAFNARLSKRHWWNTLAHVFNAFANTVASWRRRRRTISALMELDDHVLKDIGFHRSEIPSVAGHLLASPRAFGRS